MKIQDMEARRAGKRVSYIAPVTDDAGNKHFELEYSGPPALVKRVFAEADVNIRIRPHATQQDLQRELQGTWPNAHQDLAPLALDPFSRKPKAQRLQKPTAVNSVVMRLSRTQGKGTVFAIGFPGLSLPKGLNFFAVMPPACNAFAVVQPLAGDPDLFLSLNSPAAPPVAASTFGAMVVDSISFGSTFCFPPFVPFIRVLAFSTTVFNLNCWTFSFP